MLKKILIVGLFSGILFAGGKVDSVTDSISAAAGTALAVRAGNGEKTLSLHCPCCPQKHSSASKAAHDEINDVWALNLEAIEKMKEQMSIDFEKTMKQMNELMREIAEYLSQKEERILKQKDIKKKISVKRKVVFGISEEMLKKILSSLRNGERKVIAYNETENETFKIYVKKENGEVEFIFETDLKK